MAQSSFQALDGATLTYTTSGHGPSLVLIHGTTSDGQRWYPVVTALQATYTLRALNRRGRQPSTDASIYALEREVEDIVTLIDTLPDKQLNLLGHSFGAICALEAAVRNQGRIRKLVLYEPPIRMSNADSQTNPALPLLTQIEQGQPEEALIGFYRNVLQLPSRQINTMREQPGWQAKVKIAGTVARELDAAWNYRPDTARLKRLCVPTLLLLGETSLQKFSDATRYLQQTLPDAHVHILMGQGHGAIDGDPQAFSLAVLDFLSRPGVN
jgi:pimeloyl-ACP methyl ester carboxylesterase